MDNKKPHPDDVPEWDLQVNALLNGSFRDLFWGDGVQSSSLYVMFEPTALLQDLGLSDLPLIITQKHAWDTMQDRWDENGNLIDKKYHGVSEGQFRRLPELIQNPVAVFKSDPNAKHRGGLNILTDQADKKGNPIFVTIAADRDNYAFDGKTGPAHFVNMFARENYAEFLRQNLENGGVLYVNKEKLDANPWLTPDGAPSLSTADGIEFGAILQQKDPTVKPGERRFSIGDLSPAPTFYSKMEQEIRKLKQDKLGAASLVNTLRGKGVKAEEIKWSGIETFLEGKKSVTKQELLDWLEANSLEPEEVVLDGGRKHGELEDQDTGEVYFNVEQMMRTVRENAKMDGYDPDAVDFDFTRFTEDGIIEAYIRDDAREENIDYTTIKTDVAKLDPQWSGYITEGGEDYRELLYKMPGSDYSNQAMRTHWGFVGEGSGVLAHARVQDFETEDGTMLFIEEIQSDWHNAGQKSGYVPKDVETLQQELRDLRAKNVLGGEMTEAEIAREAELNKALYPRHAELIAKRNDLKAQFANNPSLSSAVDKIAEVKFNGNRHYAENNVATARTSLYIEDLFAAGVNLTIDEQNAIRDQIFATEGWNRENQEYTMNGGREAELANRAPEAPYSKNYYEFVLKNLLRTAAEGGYDSIGWTTGKMQEERWSSEYAEGYRIEYDQDIPKFLKKYGKQWGATVEKTQIDTGRNPAVYQALKNRVAETEAKIAYWKGELAMDFNTEADNAYYQRRIDELQDSLDRTHAQMERHRPTVWTMKITEAMKQSVLYEGQPRYSIGDIEKGPLASAVDQFTGVETIDAAAEALEQFQQYLDSQREAHNAKVRDDRALRTIKPELTEERIARNNREIDKLIDKYGEMEQTSGAQQEVHLPKKRDDNTKVRGAVQTIAAHSAVKEPIRNALVQDILDGTVGTTYQPITDSSTLESVREEIKDQKGFERVRQEWNGVITQNRNPGKEDIARGEALLVQACSEGNVAEAMKLIAEISVVGTRAGQTVQAFSLLKKMTPTGKAYYLQKAVDAINGQKRMKNRGLTLKLNKGLVENLLKAQTSEELEAAEEAIIQDLGRQMPATFADKVDAWRYTAMLTNSRTHIRNTLGNLLFAPARAVTNVLAAGAEKVLPQDQRTKSVFLSQEWKDFAFEDADTMKHELQGAGRYGLNDRIMDARPIYGNVDTARTKVGKAVAATAGKAMEKVRTTNSELMETEDWGVRVPFTEYRLPGLRSAYAKALGGFLQARGYTVDDVYGADSTAEGRAALDEARVYAINQAKRATYRDVSALAKALANFSQSSGGLGKIMLGGLTPFTTTPINIGKRALDYSVVGLGKGLLNLAAKPVYNNTKANADPGVENLINDWTNRVAELAGGDKSGSEIIETLCAGVTGTGIMAVGYLLASLGMLTGGLGDDEEDELKELQGYQEYSLTIGDTNYTLDWMAPLSMPLFVGAEAYRLMSDNGDSYGMTDAALSLLDPLFSMSMMDGINDVLDSVRYDQTGNAVVPIVESIIGSYAGQFIPSALGAVTRTVDADRRSSFTPTGQTGTKQWLNRWYQTNILGKSVFASDERMRYVDAWGRTDTQESLLMRAFENWVSPGYANKVNETLVDQEVNRLLEVTGNTNVAPDRATKYFTVNKEKYAMSQEEYEAHLIDRGQHAYSLVNAIINDPGYNKLDDETKAKAVEYTHEYAASMARVHTNAEYDADKWVLELADYEERGGDAATYLMLKADAKISGNSFLEVMLDRNDLSLSEQTEFIFMDYNMSNEVDDPDTKDGSKYVLNDEQYDYYEQLYRKELDEQFAKLAKKSSYKKASAEERADLVKDLRSDVGKEVRADLVKWLKKNKVKPVKDE